MVVFINLQFDSLVALFGLCGGWGISFVVYVIPSLIALQQSRGTRPVYFAANLLSLVAAIGMVATYTYVAF